MSNEATLNNTILYLYIIVSLAIVTVTALVLIFLFDKEKATEHATMVVGIMTPLLLAIVAMQQKETYHAVNSRMDEFKAEIEKSSGETVRKQLQEFFERGVLQGKGEQKEIAKEGIAVAAVAAQAAEDKAAAKTAGEATAEAKTPTPHVPSSSQIVKTAKQAAESAAETKNYADDTVVAAATQITKDREEKK